jgi:hypothetical protein
MDNLNFQNEISRKIIKNPNKYIEDAGLVDKKVKESKAIYKGKPVPYLYIPRIFNKKDIENIEKLTEDIFNIVNKTIKLYLEEKKVRKLFNFDKKLEELIKAPHYYDTYVPMGRFDIFYYGDDYKFCELNADGSSAMNEDKELSRILLKSKPLKEMQDYNFKSFELFDSWVDTVEEIYQEYKKNRKEKIKDKSQINIGIVDLLDKTTKVEIEEFKKYFEKAGYNCFVIDGRELDYKDGDLLYQDKKIDIIYRRLVTKDLMDNYDTLENLIMGILSGKTCIIGPIKSQIIHTKKFFQVLYDNEFRKYLDEEEIKFIDNHIPHTKILKKDNDWEHYIENKDDYIIKPVDFYASKGVYSGKDYKRNQWEAILEESAEGEYIIQEFCIEAKINNIIYDKGKLKYNTFNNINGLYMYNEKFKGIYTRAGMRSIISGLHEGYSMASLMVAEK